MGVVYVFFAFLVFIAFGIVAGFLILLIYIAWTDRIVLDDVTNGKKNE